MASKALATIVLVLSLNLLFLSVANAGSKEPKCQQNGLTLNVCANVLGDFLKLRVGKPQSPCCSLVRGLVDLEADACLCTEIDVNLLGLIDLRLPLQLQLLLNYCGMKPRNFRC